MADATFEAFFGIGGGGVGLFPLFPPKRATKNALLTGLDGFAADGDCIVPPVVAGAAAPLAYHNSAGGLVWSKVPTNINAACDNWGAFYMDSVDNLLWVTAIDDALSRNYLATIDAAGTVVVKGFFSGGTSLASGWYGNTAGGAKSGPSMWRTTQGTGNLYVTANGALIEIDSATGALVASTPGPNAVGWFQTSDEVALSVGAVGAGDAAASINSAIAVQMYTPGTTAANGPRRVRIYAPLHVGLPAFGPNAGVAPFAEIFAILHWRGELVFLMPSSVASTVGPAIFDRGDFTASADQLVLNYRMAV